MAQETIRFEDNIYIMRTGTALAYNGREVTVRYKDNGAWITTVIGVEQIVREDKAEQAAREA